MPVFGTLRTTRHQRKGGGKDSTIINHHERKRTHQGVIVTQVREKGQDRPLQHVDQAVEQGSRADRHVRRHRAEPRVLHHARLSTSSETTPSMVYKGQLYKGHMGLSGKIKGQNIVSALELRDKITPSSEGPYKGNLWQLANVI